MTAPITLRELEKSDLPKLNGWRNDKTLLDSLVNNFLFIAGPVDEHWYEEYLRSRDKAIRLSILLSDSGEYIGNVNLTAIHPINRSAEFSIMIGEEKHRSKGLGALATRMMLKHAFNDRGLNRVGLTVLKDNVRACKMYERLGFQVEGVKRRELFKNNAFHDVVLMSLLAEEFRP